MMQSPIYISNLTESEALVSFMYVSQLIAAFSCFCRETKMTNVHTSLHQFVSETDINLAEPPRAGLFAFEVEPDFLVLTFYSLLR